MSNQVKWWQAVLDRDKNFEGRFFYAVRSTGIYCRPTCPSRRPDRSQVLFFTVGSAAEKAGFRPCRRCKPQEPLSASADLVRKACVCIQENHQGAVTLGDLSRHLHVSASHLQRTFKRTLGISPAQYADAFRMKTVKASLRRGVDVTTSLYDAGFGSSSRLYERVPSAFGMTPATYGKGGLGIQIVYTVIRCSLGMLLVAATSRGLCAVALGDSDAELKRALEAEYSRAEIVEDNRALKTFVKGVLNYLDGTEPRLDFPLDIRATAFQCRVWEELRRIPYGTTVSYSELATAVGRPKAARAVARACATNPLALVIPCHRVVARNGDFSGYRWGRERKQALLAAEQKPKRR